MPNAPRRRSLESLRKEAKRWLAALDTDPAARDRLRRAHPDAPAAPTLRDVQHALARELGHPGWSALREQLMAEGDAATETLAHYEEKAAALLDAYRLGTPEAMERHWRLTWHRRAWKGMRTYVQIDLGKAQDDTIEITLDDARWLVAREHDYEDWDHLRRAVAAAAQPAQLLTKPMGVVHGDSVRSDAPALRSRDWRAVLRLLADAQATGLVAHGEMTDERARDLERDSTVAAHVTTLQLEGSSRLTDDGVRHLATLPHLRHLNLQGTSVTDAGLAALAELRSLQTLSLSWTAVTDAGVRALAALDQLERIDLTGTRCGDGSIHTFAGKGKLRHFRSGEGITDAGLSAFHSYPAFTSWTGGEESTDLTSYAPEPNCLYLRGRITDHGVATLADLHGLYALELDAAHLALTGRALEPLVGLEHLGWLAFDARDDAMPVIARFPHLRFLGCQDTPASDAAWAELGRSRSIEAIWGRRCHGLGDKGFAALSRMPRLTKLSVSCLNVSDAALEALPDFPSLRELMPMDIPDAGYRHIGKCLALESLVLMYCRSTTDVATSHITQLPNLRKYFASYTQITDETPRLLSGVDSLEEITFSACAGISDAGVAALARLPRLRSLSVSGRGLTPQVSTPFPASVTVHYSI